VAVAILLTPLLLAALPDDRFIGGAWDGYASTRLQQFIAHTSAWMSGGASDGYGRAFLLQYDRESSPQRVSVRFGGGNYDGYARAFSRLYDSETSPQQVSVRFAGGSYDGYTRTFSRQYDSAVSPQHVSPRFTGGSFDGYRRDFLVQYLSETSPQFVSARFLGGVRDGTDVALITGLRNPLFRDSDNDGLPDWWELPNFGGVTNAVPTADTDKDGATEEHEFASDTDPQDRTSYFHVSKLRVTNDIAYVTFACSTQRLYSLTYRADLTSGTWMPVPDQTNLPGSAEGTLTLSGDGASSRVFLRPTVLFP